jgi:hypothetical protein
MAKQRRIANHMAKQVFTVFLWTIEHVLRV